jgi:hypothetical protein
MRLAGPWCGSLSGRSDRAGVERGQVVLTAQIDNGPDVLLLLTPKSPAGTQQTP